VVGSINLLSAKGWEMVGVYIYCQKVWGDWEEILVVSYRV
jgi:hypothetical protein